MYIYHWYCQRQRYYNDVTIKYILHVSINYLHLNTFKCLAWIMRIHLFGYYSRALYLLILRFSGTVISQETWISSDKAISRNLYLNCKLFRHLNPSCAGHLWDPEFVIPVPLPWRHNGRDGVSNHQPSDCLLNHLFRRRSKKPSKLRVTGLCEGNSPVNSPHKWPVTQKCFHSMASSCKYRSQQKYNLSPSTDNQLHPS